MRRLIIRGRRVGLRLIHSTRGKGRRGVGMRKGKKRSFRRADPESENHVFISIGVIFVPLSPLAAFLPLFILDSSHLPRFSLFFLTIVS